MTSGNNRKLTAAQEQELIATLKKRFEKNKSRHAAIDWLKVETKLKSSREKLWSLHQMEISGGEPDLVAVDKKTDQYIFYDCSPESPAGRRSVCYDQDGLASRKEFQPKNNAVDMAASMGIELLTEENYRALQQLGKFDSKTSSWVKTPESIRKLGGALFMDFRYETVFTYHNGAQSYYAARGFRACLKV